jgi:ribosome-associated protein YbcJ (S4-like RNA binding protein)
MKDSKNQMIRSMKSFQTGGTSDDACMEEYVAADGKKRKRRKSKCGKTKTVRVKSSGSSTTGRDILLGLGAAAAGAFGLNKMLNQQKKGGTVKRTTKKK